MAASAYCFSVGILESLNGYKLKGIEPDERGFFPMVIGCIGIPTRAGVIYDPPSLVAAMKDTASRFNICLRDGNLKGEYGHPVIERKEDIPRLLRIDEHYISHYFGEIRVDSNPIIIKGMEALPIRAKVKPTGPYGQFLEKELRDPYQNTSFSIRSLCLPMNGPDAAYEYRKVQMVITFDAVHAPGYDITSKRYVNGSESLEMDVTKMDLTRAVASGDGMESFMLTDNDIKKLYNDKDITLRGKSMGTDLVGSKSFMDNQGNLRSVNSLVYRR